MFKKYMSPIYSRFGSKTEFFYDEITDTTRIRTTKNKNNGMKAIKDKRNSISQKQTRFFDERHENGWRVVAMHDMLDVKIAKRNGELDGTQESMMKFIDRRPQDKVLDVGLTFVKKKRSLPTQKYRDNLEKIQSG